MSGSGCRGVLKPVPSWLAAACRLACLLAFLGPVPAFGQAYGYGNPPTPPGGYAPPQGYGPPQAYAPPPPPRYQPPGSRCAARFPDTGEPLLCRMQVRKPIGAPCRCISPPPPGYPPEPAVPGRVIR